IAKAILQQYGDIYMNVWMGGMRKKLGLQEMRDDDQHLIETLLQWMEKTKADYTNVFIDLTFRDFTKDMYKNDGFQKWLETYDTRLEEESLSEAKRETLMKQYNPAVIPRNYFVEEALDQAVNEQDLT